MWMHPNWSFIDSPQLRWETVCRLWHKYGLHFNTAPKELPNSTRAAQTFFPRQNSSGLGMSGSASSLKSSIFVRWKAGRHAPVRCTACRSCRQISFHLFNERNASVLFVLFFSLLLFSLSRYWGDEFICSGFNYAGQSCKKYVLEITMLLFI